MENRTIILRVRDKSCHLFQTESTIRFNSCCFLKPNSLLGFSSDQSDKPLADRWFMFHVDFIHQVIWRLRINFTTWHMFSILFPNALFSLLNSIDRAKTHNKTLLRPSSSSFHYHYSQYIHPSLKFPLPIPLRQVSLAFFPSPKAQSVSSKKP